MPSQLEIIANQQKEILLNYSNFNNLSDTNRYSPTHTRAVSDEETPEQGKGTGVFLDTENGGSSIDNFGVPAIAGSGKVANIAVNIYNANNPYTNPLEG